MSVLGWVAVLILAVICSYQALQIRVLELQVSEILKTMEDCIRILNKITSIFNGGK